jgi:hypothetical protein
MESEEWLALGAEQPVLAPCTHAAHQFYGAWTGVGAVAGPALHTPPHILGPAPAKSPLCK